MVTRKIIHLDLDAFFCAVEELRDPSLKGKPFAVGGNPDERGVVSSCSYAARMYGVRSAMPMRRAMRICPQLILVSPGFHAYHEASDMVMNHLKQITPLFEQISIDEAFLDVSDMPQSGLEVARSIQATVLSVMRLPCSLGVASNKLVAKMATDAGKSEHKGPTPPCAIKVIPAGGEAAFLESLPVRAMWGVGPKTAETLKKMGVWTIGQLANCSERGLTEKFGKNGRDLALHARGIDDRPVENRQEIKSISQEITFRKDIDDPEILLHTLRELCEQVAHRLRKDGFCASTLRLKLRWPDFSLQSRQVSPGGLVDQDGIMFEHITELFYSLWQPGKAVRLLGVGVSGLERPAHQLSLWETPNDKERRLLEAIDDLHYRYGMKIIQRGDRLKRG